MTSTSASRRHRAHTGMLALMLPALMALGACDRGDTPPTAAPDTDTDTDTDTDGADDSDGVPVASTCGPTGERFNDLAWLPRKAKFVALVDLEAPAEARTRAAQRLAALDDDTELGLPVFAQFELDSLGLGTTTVSALLGQLGLAPHDLLKATTTAGLPVWMLPSTCDVDELTTRLAERWEVSVRNTVDSRVGTAPEGAPLPFDVLLLPGDRIALVPRGRHAEARSWLASAAGSEATADGAAVVGDEGEPSKHATLAAHLLALPRAPYRVVFAGRSLIDPDSTLVREDPSTPTTIRADAEGLWIDGAMR